MKITPITDSLKKQNVTRLILEALPDWFGIPEAREEYIAERSLGFKEFEVFPTLWDEWNPCQIYIMNLR